MNIAPDKKKHFFVGAVMGIVLQAFFLFLLPAHLLLTMALTLFFSAAIGYGFELFSKFTGMGHYDIMDAVATAIGGTAGLAAVVIIHLL